MSYLITVRDDLPKAEDLVFGSLFAATHTVKEWSGDGLINEEWTYHEAFSIDAGRRTEVLVTRGGSSSVLWVPDLHKAYEQHEHDEYTEDAEDVLLADDVLDIDQWDGLFDAEPAVHGAEGPMMNYWYECPAVEDNPVEAAIALRNTPLCVVEVDDTWGLALTGGGMDLTWEIVEAYVRLGQLPPATRAGDLPAMSGRGRREKDRLLIEACLRSLDEAAQRFATDRHRLAENAARWRATLP